MIYLETPRHIRYPGRGGLVLLILLLCAGCQPTLDERLSLARSHIEAGDYRASIIELKNVLRESPSHAEARGLLAQAFYQMADFPAAIGEFERSLHHGGDSKPNWIGLGEALLRSGRAAEALERVVPNLDSDTSDERELSLLANVYASLGNYDQASALFERLLAIDGESEQGLVGRAMVAASRGNTDLADKLLELAVRSPRASSRAYLVMGYNKRLHRDLSGAILAFERAVEREDVHTNLADRFDVRAALAMALIDDLELERAQSVLGEMGRFFPGHPIHHYLRGRIAFAEGDLDQASIELQRYLAREPNDLRANVVIGAVSFYQNYYRQAEMYLRQAVRENVGGETAVRLLAETRLRLNRPEEALDLLRGTTVDNSDVSVLGLLGRAEFRSGNHAAGLSYFEKAVAANPESTEMQLMYSMALMADGQNDVALRVLDSIPETAGSGHQRVILKLLALERKGDRQAAVRMAAEFLADNAGDAAAHAIVGSYRQSIGDTRQASEHFRNALEIDSSNRMALMGMASLAKDSGQFDDAEDFLDRLLKIEPTNLPALAMLSDILLTNARYAALASRLDAAVSAAPALPELRLLQGKVALASGESGAAMAIVRKAREAFPDIPDFQHLEGLVLIDIGQIESALISLARAATLEPDNDEFQFDLAVASLHVRDYYGADKAIRQYRRVNPLDPVGLSVQVSALIGQRNFSEALDAVGDFVFDAEDAAVGNVLLGDIYLADGRASEAIPQFEAASETLWDQGIALRLSAAHLAVGSEKAPQPLVRWLADHPDDVVVRRSYGELLQISGSNADAIKEYEAVVAANENDAIALNNLAWEYALSGRLEAVALAKRAYELEPEQPSIIDTYAWVLFLNDDPRGALQLLRKAVKLAPGNANINYHLAKVLAETGEKEEAAKMVEELLMSNQDFASRGDALALAESLQR